jgi:CBS domain-containing protein
MGIAGTVAGEKPTVGDYMTRDVATVDPDATVAEVTTLMTEGNGQAHTGFPVCEGAHVLGFVSARDLLDVDEETPIEAVMSTDLLVAHPEMDVQDAARVILRSGIQKLPVVDDEGELVGIISNTDVIRSQIERATPEKVEKLTHTLETIHGVDASEQRRTVTLADLVPTQGTVYADELEGRRYELKRGLAEPLVVIDNGTGDPLILADGHHRVLAARQMDIEEMDAYVIVLDRRVELGLERTAEREGLETIQDIEVVDYARHPLVETTERLQ